MKVARLHILSVFPLLLLSGALRLHAQVWSLEGPSSRHSHTAVFDSANTLMVVFGGQATTTNLGLNDVWLGSPSTTQGLTFTQELPKGTLPQGRFGHVATYDSVSNRMMVFGGALGNPAPCANDVWILDGANGKKGSPTWIAENPAGTAPAARVYSAGAYDPVTNSLIVFGGSDCSSGFFSDVWLLSNANGNQGTPTWSKLATFGTAPLARQSATATYDSVNNILTIYGGDAGNAPFSDVWVLSNANGTGGTAVWTRLSPTGTAPPPRTGHTAVYDSVDNRAIIFGGATGAVTLTDSWILTAANGIGTPTWVSIPSSGTAPSLAYHSAVYSQSGNFMYVFAGSSSADKLQTNSHAFALTAANGLSKVQSRWLLSGPSVRYGQTSFYDATTNSAFVFGGQHSKNNLNFNDYWRASNVLNSSNLKWTLLTTQGGPPSARYGQAGAYDSGSNRMMIFGGSTGTCQNDYHVLQHANGQGGALTWLAITTTGSAPSARVFQASAYDSATNTLMIFGGSNCKTTFFNEVWILKNANAVSQTPSWTKLNPIGTRPSMREASTAVYDPTTDSLIVYGGDSGANPFGDLWILSHATGVRGTPAWTQLTPSNNGPVARSGQTADYDVTNNRMIVYGGFDGTNVLSDVWVLTGANGVGTATWTQGVSGQPRRYHSSQYDPTSNQMITFGGASSDNPLVPSDDLYTLTQANGLP